MTDSETRYKVSRVATEFGLDDIEDELAAYWTRDEDSYSLRELADHFNRSVLAAAMRDAGMNPLDGEVRNAYRLLTDDDVSSGVRTELEKKLEREGIDVDRLTSSFVTYQAVRSYLKDGRDIEPATASDADRIETVEESIARLQNRAVTVTEEKLARLRSTDRVEIGDFQVVSELRVFCETCGRQYSVSDLLSARGCACADEEPDRGSE